MTDLPIDEYERRYRPGAEAGDPAAMAGLGWALLQQGRHDEAEQWYARAAEAGHPQGMTGLAHLLERRGEKERALPWWRRAAAAGEVPAIHHLARVLRRNDSDEAQRWQWHAQVLARQESFGEPPAEVLAAAAAAGLGTRGSAFGWEGGSRADVSLGCGLLVAAALAVLGVLLVLVMPVDEATAGLRTLSFVGAGVVAAGAVVLWLVRRHEAHDRIWLFEHGLVHRDRNRRLAALPWTQLRLRRYHGRVQGAHYAHSRFVFTIERADGPPIVVKSPEYRDDEVFVLGDTIERRITAVRLPAALTALEQGKRLDFGDLRIDMHGISCGPDSLPWTRVEAVDAVNGRVQVKQAGAWLSWSRTPVDQIPDVIVLLALAAALRDTAAGGHAAGY